MATLKIAAMKRENIESGLASSASGADKRSASHEGQTHKTGCGDRAGLLAAVIFGDCGDREQGQEADSKGRSEKDNAGKCCAALAALNSAADMRRG